MKIHPLFKKSGTLDKWFEITGTLCPIKETNCKGTFYNTGGNTHGECFKCKWNIEDYIIEKTPGEQLKLF